MEGFRKALEGEGVSRLAATNLSQIPEGQGQYLITNWPDESGLVGVVNGRLIPLLVI